MIDVTEQRLEFTKIHEISTFVRGVGGNVRVTLPIVAYSCCGSAVVEFVRAAYQFYEVFEVNRLGHKGEDAHRLC